MLQDIATNLMSSQWPKNTAALTDTDYTNLTDKKEGKDMHKPITEKPDRSKVSRRQFLLTGASVAILAGVPLRSQAASDRVDSYQFGQLTLDGAESPFPVPWLDKNGSHNQSPGPNAEPASIYHFKGFVARSNDFKGMGNDNNGKRVAFGAPSTDFSLLSGEYWAGRTSRAGAFSHI
jgi:hypothetical protein